MKTIETLVRYHAKGNISYLKTCLESLLAQTHPFVKISLLCQNVSDSEIEKIRVFFQSCRSEQSRKATNKDLMISNFNCSDDEDIRSLMLVEGIKRSESDYIAMLDYDDIIFPSAYEALLDRFTVAENSNLAVVSGGLNKVVFDIEDNREFMVSTEPIISRKYRKHELFHHNVLPLHSYMIKSEFLKGIDLSPLNSLTMFEDYAILLILATQHDFDFELFNFPLGEYRFRTHLQNSTQLIKSNPTYKQRWIESYKQVEEFKAKTLCQISLYDLKRIIHYERTFAPLETSYDFYDFSELDGNLKI